MKDKRDLKADSQSTNRCSDVKKNYVKELMVAQIGKHQLQDAGCYELSVCVPPNSYVEALIHYKMVFGGEAFGR